MRILLTTLTWFISTLLIAQAPALIPYQAVARDASGQPLANTNVNARFTIHDGSATGVNVWQEMQTVSTSALGLFIVQLGSSMPLSGVNWSDGLKFMQVEIDLGSGFVDIGTQQLLSVPYALHAGSVHLDVSATGDTLFVGDGSFVIVPGISEANNFTTGSTLHTCGVTNVHNPNLTYGSMTDQEGNVYKTIIIGMQEWMAENLNTGTYRNGEIISNMLLNEASGIDSVGAWTYINDDVTFACPYGKLYNWHACVDPRQLCPGGWHVPSIGEFQLLIDFLGGYSVAGGKLKSVGTIEQGTGLWYESLMPNSIPADNSSGFSAVPAGQYPSFFDPAFLNLGEIAHFQTSTEFNSNSTWICYVDFISDNIQCGQCAQCKPWGFSVRCLRD